MEELQKIALNELLKAANDILNRLDIIEKSLAQLAEQKSAE